MFGVGLPEMFVIALVAVIVFGPDRLPDFARQAGRMVRQLKQFADNARDDIRSELGPDYQSFELRDLDPRRAVQRFVQDAWEEPEDLADSAAGARLAPGERPPYDADAT